MDEAPKLPAEKVDALAGRLQTSLQRRRPSPWPLVATALAAVAVLALLAWWLYAPSNVPRLEVVTFDAVTVPNETARVSVQLVFPRDGKEHPASMLQGHDLLFFNADRMLQLGGDQSPEARTVSDPEGRGGADWKAPAPDKVESINVRYIDAPRKQGNTQQLVLFTWDPRRPALLVDVEETLANVADAPWHTPSQVTLNHQAGTVLRSLRQKGYQIGYLVMTPTTALGYRDLRQWTHLQGSLPTGFPQGPVLGRRQYPSTIEVAKARGERLEDLKARFSTNTTLVVRSAEAAQSGTAAGVRVIALDPTVAVPGVATVRDWPEVEPLLDKETKE